MIKSYCIAGDYQTNFHPVGTLWPCLLSVHVPAYTHRSLFFLLNCLLVSCQGRLRQLADPGTHRHHLLSQLEHVISFYENK